MRHRSKALESDVHVNWSRPRFSMPQLENIFMTAMTVKIHLITILHHCLVSSLGPKNSTFHPRRPKRSKEDHRRPRSSPSLPNIGSNPALGVNTFKENVFVLEQSGFYIYIYNCRERETLLAGDSKSKDISRKSPTQPSPKRKLSPSRASCESREEFKLCGVSATVRCVSWGWSARARLAESKKASCRIVTSF